MDQGRAARVRLLTVGEASARRGSTMSRLSRLGLHVVASQETRGQPVDLVVVHSGHDASVVPVVAASAARSAVPHVVISAGDPDSNELVGAIAGGASGWLSEDVSDTALRGAVRDILAGSLALNRAHVGVVVRELQRRSERTLRRANGRPVQLTVREWDVLGALATGASGTEVATMLGVSQTTVRGYVASAVRRLGAEDRAAAVAMFKTAQEPAAKGA